MPSPWCVLNRRTCVVALVIVAVLLVGLYFNLASPFTNGQSTSVTFTGTLGRGVEAGCVLLRADSGISYLLLGWSNYPPAGTRVTVTGYYVTVASYCMQGESTIHVVSLFISPFTSVTYVSSATASASSATVITGSTARSSTIAGEPITVSGFVFMAVESPRCYPQCGAPSFILTYLYVPPGTGCTGSMECYPPPRYYRLFSIDGSPYWATAQNGTYATITGLLTTPSSWNCDSFYFPKICMSGDIYVQSITYSSAVQSTAMSFPQSTTEQTGLPNTSIAGFDLPSIVAGLLLGLTILIRTKRSHERPEASRSHSPMRDTPSYEEESNPP